MQLAGQGLVELKSGKILPKFIIFDTHPINMYIDNGFGRLGSLGVLYKSLYFFYQGVVLEYLNNRSQSA